jgi:hypothetical protein
MEKISKPDIIPLEHTLCSITRPNERAGDHFEKTDLQAPAAVALEFLGRNIALHGQVINSRP